MTDIENIIITRINNVLTTNGFTDIVGSSYKDVPSSFPWVFLVQSDTYEVVNKHNSSRVNNHETVVFEADIYSNKKNNAKGECKKIAKIIDEEMSLLGFARTSGQPLQPTSDLYNARFFARYRAEIDSNKYIYHI